MFKQCARVIDDIFLSAANWLLQNRPGVKKSNLCKHAKIELQKLTHRYDSEEEDLILPVISLIAGQGHCGGSLFFVRDTLDHLLNFYPLTPITEEDGWIKSDLLEQHTRCHTVFKENGKILYIEKYLFTDDDGTIYSRPVYGSEEISLPWKHCPPIILSYEDSLKRFAEVDARSRQTPTTQGN